MAEREFKNVFLADTETSHRYTSRQQGGRSPIFPPRSRADHGQRIKQKLSGLWAEETTSTAAVSTTDRHGTYVEFISEPGFELYTKSLENIRSGVRLLNVRTEVDEDGVETNKATVYIPKGKENYFVKKVDEYLTRDTTGDNPKPKNQKLISSISDIKRAVVESFWTGKKEWMPHEDKVWCEIWINEDNADSITSFRACCTLLNIETKDEVLRFPERSIILSHVSRTDLENLIKACDHVAEIRRATETAAFFVNLDNKEQAEWVDDLNNRLNHNNLSDVHVSILDTGVNNGHSLLQGVLTDTDCFSYIDDWGTADHDGHGTSMAGVCVFGDLQEALESSEQIEINHALESVKILPPVGENEAHLYGAITIESISKLIIDNPQRRRIVCMAVTAPKYETGDGSPSSWSAAIDELTSGYIDDLKKLFFVSAGNMHRDDIPDYPTSNEVTVIHNPGQSWNAVTVGAYTRLDSLDPNKYSGATPLAKSGEISPFTTTSKLWDRKWPIKPEIVLEGGNVLQESLGCFTCDELSVLTTYYQPHIREFDAFHATSAATAQATWMAAKLQSEYPEAWPETIRALMIHSATWTDEMKVQFLDGERKKDYGNLLRVCGYGVPDLETARLCAKNSVNLIIESELQPFDKIDGNYKSKDMHIHEIPWPKEVLEEMFDTPVEMKITLSYFIEPGPGEIGWKDRYRYPSCALRFDTNGSDTKDEFYSRISREADRDDNYQSSSIGWLLGPNNRNVGSIHSDYWSGNAAELSMSNLIGVYPAVGWWRERHHLNKWDQKVRYSLVVSISTPEQDVDLYTPIMTEIRNRVATTVSV